MVPVRSGNAMKLMRITRYERNSGGGEERDAKRICEEYRNKHYKVHIINKQDLQLLHAQGRLPRAGYDERVGKAQGSARQRRAARDVTRRHRAPRPLGPSCHEHDQRGVRFGHVPGKSGGGRGIMSNTCKHTTMLRRVTLYGNRTHITRRTGDVPLRAPRRPALRRAVREVDADLSYLRGLLPRLRPVALPAGAR